VKSSALVTYSAADGVDVSIGTAGPDQWQKDGDSIIRAYQFNSGTASFIDGDEYLSLDGVTVLAERAYAELDT
jgi:hypothetical protein